MVAGISLVVIAACMAVALVATRPRRSAVPVSPPGRSPEMVTLLKEMDGRVVRRVWPSTADLEACWRLPAHDPERQP